VQNVACSSIPPRRLLLLLHLLSLSLSLSIPLSLPLSFPEAPLCLSDCAHDALELHSSLRFLGSILSSGIDTEIIGFWHDDCSRMTC
jgi:hypothetical protein